MYSTDTLGRIMLAVTPPVAARIERVLFDQSVKIVHDVEEARLTLRLESFRLAICGVYFDESRMFELIPAARSSRLNSDTPILCILGIRGRLSGATVRGLEETIRVMPGCSWLNVAAIPDDEAGNARLRDALLAHLICANPTGETSARVPASARPDR
jgi:hypothetical protein